MEAKPGQYLSSDVLVLESARNKLAEENAEMKAFIGHVTTNKCSCAEHLCDACWAKEILTRIQGGK